MQKFEIDEKLALEFIGARTARNQQNDIGALEGFYKKMKGAIDLSKKNAENEDVVNFYIDSGYRGFQQKYFIDNEQEQVAKKSNKFIDDKIGKFKLLHCCPLTCCYVMAHVSPLS
jgi:hypothetical protein